MRFRLRTLLIVLAIGPPLLVPAQEKQNPAEALYGEWEVVEMILHAKVQDFGGSNGGWFLFESEGFIRSFNASQRAEANNRNGNRKWITQPCTIGAREIDIGASELFGGKGKTLKALYELKGDRLRIVWREDHERPADFDASSDPLKTLFVLKKVK